MSGWYDWMTGRSYRNVAGYGIGYLADLMGISKDDQARIVNDVAQIPYIGGIIQNDQQRNQFEDYLKNTNQTWSDVKYPALVRAGGYGSSIGSTYGFVSSNIKDLYKE